MPTSSPALPTYFYTHFTYVLGISLKFWRWTFLTRVFQSYLFCQKKYWPAFLLGPVQSDWGPWRKTSQTLCLQHWNGSLQVGWDMNHFYMRNICVLHLVHFREVSITPNGAWGGEGSLGCGIGYGEYDFFCFGSGITSCRVPAPYSHWRWLHSSSASAASATSSCSFSSRHRYSYSCQWQTGGDLVEL